MPLPTSPQTPGEAIDRARRVLDDRIDTIRQGVEARQYVTDVREQTDREQAELEARTAERVGDAERADVKAYNAAVSAGWSADELRKIGLPEPEKKARARRRTSRRSAPARAPRATDSAPAERGQDDSGEPESSGA